MAEKAGTATREGLSIRGLSSAVLRDVSLDLAAGEGRAIVGASGSGKTSLFRAIADLDPNEGTVLLNKAGRETFSPPEWRSRVAYVPAEPAWWLPKAGDHADAGAWSLAEQLGLAANLRSKPVRSLSTGERQRLALAIAIARKPDVLLLDEPTSALDEHNRDEVEAMVGQALADGTSLLMASHDPDQIERLRLPTLHVVGGRIVETATE